MIWYLLIVVCPTVFTICCILAWKGTKVSTLSESERITLKNHLASVNKDNSWNLH